MSCILDDATVREEVRFIENNPVRKKIVFRADDYAWSSAFAHRDSKTDQILSERCFLLNEIKDWQAFLIEQNDQSSISRVRSHLRTGRPAGNPEFVQTLEKMMGRHLKPLPIGRPRGKTGNQTLNSTGRCSST